MRRLIRSRLIWISAVCKCMFEFTWCPKLPDFTLMAWDCLLAGMRLYFEHNPRKPHWFNYIQPETKSYSKTSDIPYFHAWKKTYFATASPHIRMVLVLFKNKRILQMYKVILFFYFHLIKSIHFKAAEVLSNLQDFRQFWDNVTIGVNFHFLKVQTNI